MTLRWRNAFAWITVQAVLALSGAAALFVGANNARCDLPDLFDTGNGPFGGAADSGLDYQALFDIGRWAIILAMMLGIPAVLFGMFVAWTNRIHVRTLLGFMVLAGTQATVTIALWSIQIERNDFCGLNGATVTAAAVTAVLLIATIAFSMSRTTWSSFDLATAPPLEDTPLDHPTPDAAASLTSASLASVLVAATATATATPATEPSSSSPPSAMPGPLVVQMAGHGGAGKSTVARELASRLDATVLDLDVIKSELLDAGATWDGASSDSYDTIYRRVDGLLGASDAIVIVDTPSYWPEIHERLMASADRYTARYVFLECIAAADTRATRLQERSALRSQAPAAGENPSDAPSELGDVHARIVAAPQDATILVVDTDRAVDFDNLVTRLAAPAGR